MCFNSRPCERGDRWISRMKRGRPCLFQFTPLREGRHGSDGAGRPGGDGFNSRPCERGDRIPARDRRYFSCFNSRPCERGDRQYADAEEKIFVSIHAPARGATRPARRKIQGLRFQFTPLREGRPQPVTFPNWGNCVSIHAPARGATIFPSGPRRGRYVSIHAPARGATSTGCAR